MDDHPDDDKSATGTTDPDVRFTYANERTFLAWNRTALALVALGAYVSVASYRQWRANQRAMRAGEALPASRMPFTLATGIGLVAIVAVVLGAIGAR
jgi:putative membrane protein